MKKDNVLHNFRVANLKEYQAIQSLADLNLPIDKPRLNIFVTHQGWLVDADWQADRHYTQLCDFLTGYQKKDYTPDISPEDRTYIQVNATVQGKEAIDAFCRKICQWQNEAKSILLFVNGVTYRELLRSGMHSEIVLDARRYLVWDDGMLWSAELLPLTAEKAWAGNAWCRLIWYCWYDSDHSEQKIDDELIDIINTEADALNQRRLTQLDLTPSGRNPRIDVAMRLFAYMPRYRDVDGKYVYYPLHFQRGYVRPLDGPAPWKGLFDSRLSDLERDMILEGWLTLWPNPDQSGYTLQPASVLLLYWAAHTLGHLTDPNPDHFIQHHCWDGWFGGRGVTV